MLSLGAVVYLAAWAFGSRPLYPVATGLLLAVGLAWAWVRLAGAPVDLLRRTGGGQRVEGDDVVVEVELGLRGRVRPASAVVVDRISGLGTRRAAVDRRGEARYVLERVPRGRYALERGEAVLEDPFGLWRASFELVASAAIHVGPRLTELDGLFSEAGLHAHGGSRPLLRRPAGFDLQSVREHEEGESLRAVHWPTTARRGRLMVKELEDAPRDELAVVLDCDATAVVGRAPDSSFELAVRAAGSLLWAHARRGRRAALIVSPGRGARELVHSLSTDWQRALELLSTVEPGPSPPLAELLAEERGGARAAELVVVTSTLPAGLVERLLERALSRRRASLVYVDASSFGPRPGRAREPGLLRLQTSGIPVAVLRRGDDLAAKLDGRLLLPEKAAAHR